MEYRVDEPALEGGTIMDLAGIPRNLGLVLIVEDGTEQSVVGSKDNGSDS